MSIAPAVVYGLCLFTSLLCAVLLARAWQASRSRVLMFSALCFGFMALNNFFVVADMLILIEQDLTVFRQLSLAVGVAVLLYGFIWEME